MRARIFDCVQDSDGRWVPRGAGVEIEESVQRASGIAGVKSKLGEAIGIIRAVRGGVGELRDELQEAFAEPNPPRKRRRRRRRNPDESAEAEEC